LLKILASGVRPFLAGRVDAADSRAMSQYDFSPQPGGQWLLKKPYILRGLAAFQLLTANVFVSL
jgi:hypothetical protein